MTAPHRRPSPYAAGLLCRCPVCGRGPLFDGLLTVRRRCAACGFALSEVDPGDGPAALAILALGAIVVPLALWLELAYAPPLWVHAAMWGPLIVAGALALLRVIKATLFALQVRYRAGG
jgi:uncharacterized protein (DUF983 family)